MPNIGSETQHASTRLTVVLRPTHRAILLVVVAALAALIGLPILQRLREPVYQGRRVGAWFDDLCAGIVPNHDANVRIAASRAFSCMDSTAVPFLLKQLTYDQGGTIERLELSTRKVPVVSHVAAMLILPSAKRTYAAMALSNMGTNAVVALEPMLAARRGERQGSVRQEIEVAIAAISRIPTRPWFDDEAWRLYERAVLERVRKVQERASAK